MKGMFNDRKTRFALWLAGIHFTLPVVFLAILLLASACSAGPSLTKMYAGTKQWMTGEREEAFCRPLRGVIIASSESLKELGFSINRVEILEDRAALLGHARESHVNLAFEAASPGLTRVKIRFKGKEGVPQDSSAEAIVRQIRDRLASRGGGGWDPLNRGMIRIYAGPASESGVIGRIAPGIAVTVENESPAWTEIRLLSGGTGYVQTARLSLAASDAGSVVDP